MNHSITLDHVHLSGAVSLPGPNQASRSSWGTESGIFWIIEGEDQQSRAELSVRDFVDDLDYALRQRAGQSSADLRNLLGSALAHIHDRPATRAGFTASVSMAQHNGEKWEYLLLGDAAVATSHPYSLHADRRRNSPDGFWLAGDDPRVVHHAIAGSIPGDELLLLNSTAGERLKRESIESVFGMLEHLGIDTTALVLKESVTLPGELSQGLTALWLRTRDRD